MNVSTSVAIVKEVETMEVKVEVRNEVVMAAADETRREVIAAADDMNPTTIRT